MIVDVLATIGIGIDADDWNWNAVAAAIMLLKVVKDVAPIATAVVVINKAVFDLIIYSRDNIQIDILIAERERERERDVLEWCVPAYMQYVYIIDSTVRW
jgi:hypothetical protein